MRNSMIKKFISVLCIFFIMSEYIPNFFLYSCSNAEGEVITVSTEKSSNDSSEYKNEISIPNDEKPTDYYPEFYGTTEINLLVGDSLDLNKSMFRIFAKDYNDGNITKKIEIEKNTVDVNNAGNYEIIYKVTNSVGNSSTITVPVNIQSSGKRTIKRRLYTLDKNYGVTVGGSSRGYYQDRQNLGIYMKQGASLNVRLCNSDNLDVEIIHDDMDNVQTCEISSDWTTLTAEYDSVPFIKTSSIDNYNKYCLSENDGYALWGVGAFTNSSENNTFYFANVFDTIDGSDELTEIKVPEYDCNSIEVYVNSVDGNLNSDNFTFIKKIDNPSAGWETITLENPISVTSDKFAVAVKYTGTYVPINHSLKSKNYTYFSSSLNSGWKLLEGTTVEDGVLEYNNIPPIQVTGQKCKSNVELEIDLDDLYADDAKDENLTYYLQGDDEDEFFSEWNNTQAEYSLIESNRITFLVPIKDKNKIIKSTNTSKTSSYLEYYFDTIEDMLAFYDELFEKYDKFLGVEKFPEDKLDKICTAKYFVTADINGAGMAYYTEDHTGFNGDTLSYYFYKNWMILHEIGHGYEGKLTAGELKNGEVINNIFAYYMEKTYLNSSDTPWIGNISNKEVTFQNIRSSLTTYNDLYDKNLEHYHDTSLYFYINYLNVVDTEKVMSDLYQSLRDSKYKGDNTITDLIALSFARASGYNPIKYMESWKLDISDDVKSEIESLNYPTLYYLKDYANNDTIATLIKNKNNFDGVYHLVTEEQYKQYLNGVVNGIEISEPNKVNYFVGEELDTTGLGVKINYYNGVSEDISSGYEISSVDMSTAGEKSVEVSYQGIINNFTITVKEPEVIDIEITPPSKTDYIEDEDFESAGLTIKAKYDDGSEIDNITSGYNLSGIDMGTVGEQVISVEYKGIVKTFNINVKAKSVIGITINKPDKLAYTVGDSFDTFGLNVFAEYDNGLNEEIMSGYEISGFDSSTSGTKTIAISYGGYTESFEIEVNEKTLEGIEVTKPYKLEYIEGQDFDLTGLKIIAIYNNGEHIEINSGYTITGFDSSVPGVYPITVSYGDKKIEFNVTITEKSVVSIDITEPTKLNYIENQDLDLVGFECRANYDNGTTEQLTEGYEISGYDKSIIGNQTITVTYQGFTATFDVVVVEKQMEKIQIIAPSKVDYIELEKIDLSGMEVYAIYDNGEKIKVDGGYEISDYDMSKIGTQTIEIKYGDCCDSFDINIRNKSCTGITITNPDKMIYIEGEELDTIGISVAVNYDNGTTEFISEGYSIIGYDASKIGKQTIIVNYSIYQATFEVTVLEKTVEKLELTGPNKTTYKEGEELDTTGLVVTAIYDNGTSEILQSGYEISGYDTNQVGKQDVIVSYEHASAKFEVCIEESEKDIVYEQYSDNKIDAKIYDKIIDNKKIIIISAKSGFKARDTLALNELDEFFEFNSLNIVKRNGLDEIDYTTRIKTGDTFTDDKGTEYTVVLMGDVNKDGKICNAFDLAIMKKIILHPTNHNVDEISMLAANLLMDIDSETGKPVVDRYGNMKINAYDISRLKNKILGFDGSYSGNANRLGDSLMKYNVK